LDCNIVKSLFTKNIPDLREEYSECFSNPFSTKYYEIRSSGNNVEKIDIHFSTDLKESIPPELGKLRKLKTLRLYSDNLSGSIPPELGDLSELQELDLSDNNLSGTIPPELGKLTKLKIFLKNCR